MLKVKTRETDRFTWIFVEARRGEPEPTDLLSLEYPTIDEDKGIVIVNEGLYLWVIAPLILHYQSCCQWIAGYDPRLQGAIVFHSIDPEYPVSKLIPLNLPCAVCGTQLRGGAKYPYCQSHRNHGLHRQTYTLKSSPSPNPNQLQPDV